MMERDVPIEDLVRRRPETVRYLMGRGIHAAACGEPAWGTLEDVARQRGCTDDQIDTIVGDLSALVPGKRDP